MGMFNKSKMVVAGVALITGVCAAAMETITNDVFWKDSQGKFLFSQGGGAFKFGDTYYWYGVHYAEADAYAADMANKDDGKLTDFKSVTAYSSKDLVNWKFENDVLTTKSKGFGYAYWFGRLGVCYNKKTKKYVLISQYNDSVLFATSDSPTGNFEVQNVQDHIPGLPTDKMGTGDQTLFIDDDGTPYIICSNKGGRGHQYVVPLRASDYLAAEQAVEVAKGSGREGNALFKHKGKYYFCASDLHGWNSSHTYYMMADKITGPYSSWAVMEGTDEDFSHVTQTGFFVTVYGSKGSFVINAGDRWSEFAGNGPGYNQWTPITFDDKGKPKFHSLTQWRLDAETGEWEVGPKNNYALNFSFDADRVDQSTVAGWNINPVSGTVNPRSKKRTGNRGLYLSGSQTATQTLTVPNGTYSFTAWMQSSGGQSEAKLFAKDFGSSEVFANATKTLSSWTQLKVPEFKVTNGKLTIGAMTNGGWIAMDDLELIMTNQEPETKDTVVNPPTIKDTTVHCHLDSLICEAENAAYNNAVFENKHEGFSGKGYANVDNIVGSSIEFAVVAPDEGKKRATIVFANGGTASRPMSIAVNGKVIVEKIEFETTGEWANWTEGKIEIELVKGLNRVTFTSITSDGGPNLDVLIFDSLVTEENVGGGDSSRTQSVESKAFLVGETNRTEVHFNSIARTLVVAGAAQSLSLFDIKGKEVWSFQLGNSAESVLLVPNSVQSGIYFVKIHGGLSQNRMHKIVIK